MATLAADKAEVNQHLTGKEHDELKESLKPELMEDLAHKLKKDPDLIDEIPQYLANETAILDIEKDFMIGSEEEDK